MAINDINKLRLLSLFEGDKVGENRVQSPVFGARTPPEGDINAQQSYEGLFEPRNVAPPIDASPAFQSGVNQINYTPETENLKKYEAYIDQYPEQQDRNVWDRIIAGGMSLGNVRRHIPGGFKAGDEYLNAPYEREIEEWKNKIVPLGNAATQENQRNINSRNLAEMEMKERIANEKANTARIVANARDFAARNPDMDIVQPPGGFIMGINPQTGAQKYILDEEGKKIPSGKMNQEAVENLRANAAQRRAETAAGAQGTYLLVPDPNSPGDMKLVRARGDSLTDVTAAPPPAPVTPTPVPPSNITPTAPAPVTPPPRGTQGGTLPQVGDKVTPVMPNGIELPKVAPGEPQTPQVPPTVANAYRLGVQPKPEDMRAIRTMTQDTLNILANDIFDKESLAKYDAAPDKEKATAKLDPRVSKAVGASRVPWSEVLLPYSDQAAGSSRIENLKGRLVLDLIGKLKSQSDTGATGFGQLTGPELTLLINAAHRLNNLFLDEETEIIPELLKIRERLKKIMLPAESEGGSTSAPLQYRYQGDPTNPNEQRRTLDGKTYEFSHDGGKTWGPK